ncbi:MAG: hypothetical protein AB8B69_27040 [Chitinophagales bacterium]
MDTKPEEHKIKIRVFVVYYDVHFKSHKPIPKDPSFFFRILCDKAYSLRGQENGTIAEEILSGQELDEGWVDKNTFRFIRNVELIATANFPLEDYSSYDDFYYERNGCWVNEEKLVQATYEIQVTDKKYFDHLQAGMSWGTTSYETKAVIPPKNDNKLFATKIQELIADDKIDDAIIELSKLTNNSSWMRDVIMQGPRLHNIEEDLRNGTLNFEGTAIHKNRVKEVILTICSRIHHSTNDSLKADIAVIEKWDDKEELIAILNAIYKLISSILIETEEILTPFFTDNHTIEEAQDRMILLFSSQRKRGNFKRWVSFLNKQLESDSFSEHSTQAIDDLIFFLNEEFFNSFYEIVPENLDRDNLHIPINSLLKEYSPPKEEARIKKLDEKIENPSSNPEVRALQRLTFRYLYNAKSNSMDFEGVIGWLK